MFEGTFNLNEVKSMNMYEKKVSIALRLCPIVLLPLLATAVAAAPKAATTPSTEAEAPQVGSIRNITPPPVPAQLRVDEGFVAFLEGHAIGTQNYVCKP